MTPLSDPFKDMPVHEQHLPDSTYRQFLGSMPQVCVEVVLETDRGILLANRRNHPQVWFWPGGRLYKGESLDAAAGRVAREELGIEISLRERLGVYEHYWAPAREDEPSRHTVNIPYQAVPADPPAEIDLDDQHSGHRFVTDVEPWMHEYVSRYLRDGGLV